MKHLLIYFLCALTLLLTSCGYNQGTISYEEESEQNENLQSDSLTDENAQLSLYVAVTGCVVNPGVYILPDNSRVYEAINAAGGVTKEGDMNSLNLVMPIADGMTIHVKEIKPEGDDDNFFQGKDAVYADKSSMEDNQKININTADVSMLTMIPGVGETRAKAIISYREKNGKFTKIEDIMNVSGIKEGTFEKIKDYITVF